jgi:hypothetical protein
MAASPSKKRQRKIEKEKRKRVYLKNYKDKLRNV